MKVPFTTHEAVAFGWEKMKKNFGFFVVLLIVLGVLFPPLNYGGMGGPKTDESTIFSGGTTDPTLMTVIAIVVLLVVLLVVAVQVLKNIALIKIMLLISEDKKVEFDEVFQSFRVFINYIVAMFLYGVIVTIGLTLLIVPGVIWALRLQFAPYLVVDKKMHGLDALVKSWEMTRGSTTKLFWFVLASTAINVVGALFLVIGIFASLPTTWLAQVYIYKKLLNHHTS